MEIFSVSIFGITIAPTYYGLAYALGFLSGYAIVVRRASFDRDTIERLIIYTFVGVIAGGRLGYAIFYQPSLFLDPLDLVATWNGGMSFHGGILGVIVAMTIFSYRNRIAFLKIADEVAHVVPIGIGLGRIGNYLNNELYGYPGYTGPFAMRVGGVPHFPSPLLEALLEGVVLFIIVAIMIRRPHRPGQVAGAFVFFYAVFRGLVEFVRLPDAHIGYLAGTDWLTMGHVLSIPMLAVGAYFLFFHRSHAVSKRR